MFILKKLLSICILPPFSLFLLLFTALCLHRRRPRLAHNTAIFALSLLVLLSIPLVSQQLLASLENTPPISTTDLQSAQVIVVLGGGSYPNAPEYQGDTVHPTTLSRLRYAAVLQKRSHLPVLVTGGAPFGGRPEAESMRQVLNEEFEIPLPWAEAQSKDTAQNAALCAQLLKKNHIQRIALVTNAWHMRRAQEEFQRQGLTVIAAPTGFATEDEPWFEKLLPHARALHHSNIALHEWLGIFAQQFANPTPTSL